jgi:hypothetical protein
MKWAIRNISVAGILLLAFLGFAQVAHATSSTDAYQQQVIADGAGDFWPMNEASDASGNTAVNVVTSSDDGTYNLKTGDVNTDHLGYPGPFYGEGDSSSLSPALYSENDTARQFVAPVASQDASVTNGFAASFWFNDPTDPTYFYGGGESVSISINNELKLGLNLDSNDWQPYAGTQWNWGGNSDYTDYTAPDDPAILTPGWHQLALTWDQTSCVLKIYVDGEFYRQAPPLSNYWCNYSGSQNTSNTIRAYADSSTYPGGGAGHSNAYMADISLYPYDLSASQIGSIYNSENSVSKIPASALYGEDNPSYKTLQAEKHGEPVSDATGNFSATKADLSVGGVGDLGFSRTYNSQAASNPTAAAGQLGYGCQLLIQIL